MVTTAKTTAAPKASTHRPTSELEAIHAEATRQAGNMRDRMEKAAQSTQRLNDIASEFGEAIARGDIDEAQILASTYNSARQAAATQANDLAGALMGLEEQYRGIGIKIKSMNELTPEEQKIPDDAERLAHQIEGERSQAYADLAAAKQRTAWFGIQARAVAAAEEKIKKVDVRLAAAKESVTQAKQIAERMRTERLEKANLEQSFQQIQAIAVEIIGMAQGRIEDIEGALGTIEAGRVAILDKIHQLSEVVETGDRKLDEFAAQISTLTAERDEQIKDSPAWTDANTRLLQAQSDQKVAQNERDKAFALLQDAKRFLEMYKTQEPAQRDALTLQQTWIALMQAGVEHRSEVYNSLLTLLQTASDQEAMKVHDEVAIVTDEGAQSLTVQTAAALRGGMLHRMERTPENAARLAEYARIEEESRKAFHAGVNKLMAENRAQQQAAA